MNHDFTNTKIGDWAWSARNGWSRILSIKKNNSYPIFCKNETFDINGFNTKQDKHPSLFLDPPSGYQAEPKPCKFQAGQEFLIKNPFDNINNQKMIFSHIQIENDIKFYCFKEKF